MKHTTRTTLSLATALAASVALGLPTATLAADAPPSATITGSVGENVSTTDGYDGRYLRYVGDPAPDGYSSWYQWGSPYVLTESPEDGPVTIAGTLDVSGMTAAGQVAVIGLNDADALRAGDRGDKAGDGIYVAYDGAGEYTVGVTDGDAGGGEFVQRYLTLDAGDLPDGLLEVEFVVDGTADPATCASDPGDVASADGCMSLAVTGAGSVTDSYGSIVPADIVIETELGNGAHPGWYSAYHGSDGPEVGVRFELAITPVVVPTPSTKQDCKKGGYEAFGFRNQGQCIASITANGHAKKHAAK